MHKYNVHGIVVIVLLLFCNQSYALISDTKVTEKANSCLTQPKTSDTSCLNEKEKTSIDDVSKQTSDLNSEQRLKVLFVDVNSVMETLGASMDWTANWIDGNFAETEYGKNKAKAWGHISVGWEPREGEWSNFPVKFRVRAKLPNLENKAELIFSDNEQEDLNSLPYETVRPEALKSSQKSLGAAVRFLHSTSENVSTSSRIGTTEGQIYARTSLKFNKKFLDDKLTLNMQPSLEYYSSDGQAARFLFDTSYALNLRNEVRLSYLLQDRDSYEAATWRNGVYSISAISNESALIIGATAAGVVEPEYRPEFYKFSVRVRRKAIRSWIFIEIEPFVEFTRDRLVDDPFNGHQYGEFERDIGLALRFEAHYGFL